VTFWNDGTSLLDGSSIVQTDGPKISFAADSEILKITRLAETNGANAINLQRCGDHSSVAHLDFEYLDPQDGATFEILHTDPTGNAECHGKIKGIPEGIRTINPNPRGIFPRTIRRRYPKPFFLVTLALGIALLVTSVLPHHPELTAQHSVSLARIFLFVAGLMYIIGGSFALYMTRRRVPKSLLQK
jgi:hypothetical protein